MQNELVNDSNSQISSSVLFLSSFFSLFLPSNRPLPPNRTQGAIVITRETHFRGEATHGTGRALIGGGQPLNAAVGAGRTVLAVGLLIEADGGGDTGGGGTGGVLSLGGK